MKKIIGIIVGLIGTSVIILLPLLNNHEYLNISVWGNILILFAMISLTLYTVFSKPLQGKYAPVEITYFVFVVNLLGMIPFVLYEVFYTPWISHLSIKAVLGLLYVGVLGTGVYYLFFQKLIKETEPVVASTVLYLQPFSAIVLAYFDSRSFPL